MGSLDLEHFDSTEYAALSWSFTGIAVLFTTLRVFVRHRNLRTLYLEDYLAIGATICMLVAAILIELMRKPIYQLLTMTAELRAGKPLTVPATTTTSDLVFLLKTQVAFFQFFWTCLWLVKGSLMVFYRHLFVGVEGYMKWWWVVTGWCAVTFVGSCLTGWMACMPIERRWSLDPKDSCDTQRGLNAVYAASSFDIFSDIIVMILPLQLVWGVQIRLRQKVALGGVFCLGTLVIIFAAIRMAKTVQGINAASASVNVILSLWSITECFVAVIVGNLPTLKVLISRKDKSSYGTPGRYGTNKGTGVQASTTRSKISGPGTHIRLYDMGGENGNDARAAYGSEEHLNLKVGKGHGITKTQEIRVTREDGHPAGSSHHGTEDQDSLESVRKYNGAAI